MDINTNKLEEKIFDVCFSLVDDCDLLNISRGLAMCSKEGLSKKYEFAAEYFQQNKEMFQQRLTKGEYEILCENTLYF